MLITEKFKDTSIILASGSPRRKQLLASLDLDFHVQTKDTPEDFPNEMPIAEVPMFLARRKAEAFLQDIQNKHLVITADTIVSVENSILNKPQNEEEAFTMLQKLSGKMHEVITGVCLMNKQKTYVFSDITKVFFKALTQEEIRYYIEKYKPYDKAGSYGAQEWLGMVAIHHIEGSYFNVMGLPIHKLYEELNQF
ncbi:septum formation inhibitor Maf [bacterium 336/3]|nr:septum formation inhibitor Maf [bacterium 336/3]